MTQQQPLNASLIAAGQGVQDAVDLGDGIWMSRDVSNCYLVETGDGNVLVNTGFIPSAAENKRRFDAVSDAPIKRIVFTQSHEDHIGGWTTFTGPGVETIAQANFKFVRTQFRELGPAMARRSRHLWKRDQKSEITERPEPVITTSFHDSHAFEQGGRRFELYAVPGGETVDSLVVWLPNERIAFTGNMMGPAFGHVPNLYTVRGDRIRYVQWFLDAMQRLIDLKPAVVITGHGDPIRENVHAELVRIRDAVQSLRDQVFAGMNAGESLWSLMRSVALPPGLAIPQGHGKVPWIVRAIWEEHLGWFRFESTTELYEVPPQAAFADLIQLAGGPGPVLDRARQRIAAGEPLHALHLVEGVLAQEPDNRGALKAKRDATALVLEQQGRENFSEVRWLEAELRELDEQLGG